MNRLKMLRTEKNYNLEKVAKYLDVTVQTVSNYETGKRDMSTDILNKLADYFDCSIDYLLCKSDIRNPSDIKNIQFANSSGLDTEGLDEDDLLELQKQVDYIRKLKNKNK